MAIPYLQTKLLLAEIATSLAAEATTAGKPNLASQLTNVASEIANASITESEFYGHGETITSGTPPTVTTSVVPKGSAAQVWSQTLEAAADTIRSKIDNTVESHTRAIETYQKKLKELGEDEGIHWRRPSEFTNGAATYRVSSGSGGEDGCTERVVSIQNVSETFTGCGSV